LAFSPSVRCLAQYCFNPHTDRSPCLSIVAGSFSIITALLLPETYPPILLARKAKKLRTTTGNNLYYAPLEDESSRGTWSERISVILLRPFEMLFLEPIVYLSTIYLSLIYGIIVSRVGCLMACMMVADESRLVKYLLFEAYPIVVRFVSDPITKLH
jgi:hypothetical protein